MHDKSVTELRKMLKEHRSQVHHPVSKMKKHEVIAELEKHMGKEEQAVKQLEHEVKPVAAVKAVEKKVEKLHKEEKKVVAAPKDIPSKLGKAPKPSAAEMQKEEKVEKKVPVLRLVKGSQQARDYMAKIRMMRKKKDE